MEFTKKTKIFLGEVTAEMKKVSWTTRNELLSSTWIVIVSVIIFAIALGVFDFLFSQLISLILKHGF